MSPVPEHLRALHKRLVAVRGLIVALRAKDDPTPPDRELSRRLAEGAMVRGAERAGLQPVRLDEAARMHAALHKVAKFHVSFGIGVDENVMYLGMLAGAHGFTYTVDELREIAQCAVKERDHGS